MEAVACPVAMTRVRLFPEGAPPIDIEVAEGEGPVFRRAGRLRTAPIVDVPDYGDLPEPQRDAYDALVRWLTTHEARVRFGPGDPRTVRDALELTGPGLRHAGLWLFALALLLLAAAAPTWREMFPKGLSPRKHLEGGAVVAVAGVLRFALGIFGPLHVNGQGPLWVRGALEDPSALASYGPGYAELLGPIARAFSGAPDTAIFATNAALSALVPLLAYGIARAHEVDRHRALIAALLLALDPISVRTAATEAYFTPIVFLLAAAALAASVSAPELHPARRAMLVLAAALFCAQAARIHPVAWLPVAIVPLFALRSLPWAAAHALAIPAACWLTSGGWLAAVHAHATERGPGSDVLARALGSGLVSDAIVLALVGAAAIYVARPRIPLIPALAAALFALATRHAYGQSELWQASYDRLFALPIALGLAAIAPADLRLRWALPIPVAFAALLAATQPYAFRETTEQREHAFLREALEELDPDCRIAYVPRADKRVLEIPLWARPGEAPPLRIERPDDLRAKGPGCAYFVRTSICTTREARAICDAVDRGPAIAERTFDSVPSYEGLPYDRARVPVSIHTVVTDPP